MRPGVPAGPQPGLCARCRHARLQRSARGSGFWRCGLSDGDPRFPRYPALPVRACGGFAAAPDASPDRPGGS